jgi:hypothetical protein
MGYITNPSDIAIILRTLNSKEMLKWIPQRLDDWMLTNEIYDGGLEYCESMIDFLDEVRPYGYRIAIDAFERIIYENENTRY